MFIELICFMFTLNVSIYLSMDKGGNNAFLKNIESLGIPRYKFLQIFQSILFKGSFVLMFLCLILIIRGFFF